jgi:hypothetical protein
MTLRVLSLLLCAFALARPVRAIEETPAPRSRNHCVTLNLIRDRYVLDERRVLIWTRTTPYLLVLGRPVPAMTKGHNSISLIDGNHDGSICASINDGIYLEDTLMPKATNIVRLLQLDEAQVRSLEHTFNKSLQRKPRGLWKPKPQPDALVN